MARLSGPQRAPRSGAAPQSLVVLLHGRGSNGDDLIELADVIAGEFPDTAFHSPNAPIELGGFGFMWLPSDPVERLESGFLEATETIEEFIDELAMGYGLPASKIALMGFSQGSIMSIHLAPRRTEQLAGVVAFSGAMFTGDSLADEMASKPPFVLIHGADDMVLDAQGSVDAGARFDEVGIPAEVHILPGLPHGIDRRGLDLAVGFLTLVLGRD